MKLVHGWPSGTSSSSPIQKKIAQIGEVRIPYFTTGKQRRLESKHPCSIGSIGSCPLTLTAMLH